MGTEVQEVNCSVCFGFRSKRWPNNGADGRVQGRGAQITVPTSYSIFQQRDHGRSELSFRLCISTLDFTLTHPHYDRSLLNLNGQLTNTRRSDGAPEPDGVIKVVVRKKIIHHRQLYVDRPDPIAFMPVAVDTSGRIYDDVLRLLFLYAHREASDLANDIPEESGHFRFLRAECLANIKGSMGLILAKASVMRISVPLDLSSRPFIPPPCFIRSRRPTTLLPPSLVFSPRRSA